MTQSYRKALFTIVLLSICLLLTACDGSNHNDITIDDSSLPLNEATGAKLLILDGANRLPVNKEVGKIEATLCLTNLSDQEIAFESTAYVRLQKMVNGNWQFVDDRPYPDGPTTGTMIGVLPGSNYDKILVSIDIDINTFDLNGVFRFYLPVLIMPDRVNEHIDPSQIKKACVTVEVSFENN